MVPTASEYVVLKYVFQNFLGATPRPASYRVVTFMHVPLLALFLVLATTLRAFQAFWSSARQTPGLNVIADTLENPLLKLKLKLLTEYILCYF